MDKKITVFGDIETEKHKSHYHKNGILVDDVDINKTIVSNNVSFGKKIFLILNILLLTRGMKKLSCCL